MNRNSLRYLRNLSIKFESPGSHLLWKNGIPVFIKSAQGMHFRDTENNKYLDFTSFFGVANVGHRNPYVLKRIQKTANYLIHGMGDLFLHKERIFLSEKIAKLLNGKYQILYGLSGSDSVELALKTSYLYTGAKYILAFKGSYHGLSLFSLSVTHRKTHRKPFEKILYKNVKFVPYPVSKKEMEKTLEKIKILFKKYTFSSVIIEPVQGRGGIVFPAQGFLKEIEKLCKEKGALLILDEIFTGFGRTGIFFAFEKENVSPDVICLGKSLGLGFPISICAGKKEVMQAWKGEGEEALYASTFMANPISCSASLAVIEEIERKNLVNNARIMGNYLLKELNFLKGKFRYIKDVRGRGLMIGCEIEDVERAKNIWKDLLLKEKVLTLLEGKNLNTLALTPPLILKKTHCDIFIEKFKKVLERN